MPFGNIDMMEVPAEQGEGLGAPIPHKSKKRRRRERLARERGGEYVPQGHHQARPAVAVKNGMEQTLAAVTRDAKRKAKGGGSYVVGPAVDRPASTRQSRPTGRAARKRLQRELKADKRGGRR